jgi:hypothetical protein
MRSALLVLLVSLLTSGCGKNASKHAAAANLQFGATLDELLAVPEYSSAIAEAQRDLPQDKWEEKPFHHNESRAQREGAVAQSMLDHIRPRLQQMNAIDLVRSLKVHRYPAIESFPGVAEYVYAWGNCTIIKELQSRPRGQLEAAARLADDKLEVYEGPQGSGETLADVINGILTTKGRMPEPTRTQTPTLNEEHRGATNVLSTSTATAPAARP